MIGELAIRVVEAWLVCGAGQAALWLVAERTQNAGVAEVGWAQSFTAVILVFAVQPLAPRASWLPIAILVVVWSTRLTCHLVTRGAATGAEPGRYALLRQRSGPHASRRLFGMFQAHGALTAVLSTAFVVPFVAAPAGGGWLRALGLVVGAVGLAGETVADVQLARHERDPAHVGRACDVGLWRYSRRANHAFQACTWFGLAIYGLAYPLPYALLGLAGPAILVAWRLVPPRAA